jgi:hypothetical protein
VSKIKGRPKKARLASDVAELAKKNTEMANRANAVSKKRGAENVAASPNKDKQKKTGVSWINWGKGKNLEKKKEVKEWNKKMGCYWAGGEGLTMKITKCKLNMFGAIQSHSDLANNEQQLNKLKNRHILAALLAQVNQLDRVEVAAKKDEDEVQKWRQVHDGAIVKLAC